MPIITVSAGSDLGQLLFVSVYICMEEQNEITKLYKTVQAADWSTRLVDGSAEVLNVTFQTGTADVLSDPHSAYDILL